MSQSTPQPDPAQAARKVELIVAQLEALPTLPRIATQLLRLTRGDDASSREVIQLIKQDPALTAKILSLAHRAGSGIRDEITTVDKCVLLMGLDAVRSAALSIKIFEVFGASAGGPATGGLDMAGFWTHSLAVALACEQLGPHLTASRPGPAPEELFVAGLLHDIGKAALHFCLPKSYGKVIDAVEATRAPLIAVERKLIGIDHALVGKRLGQRWNLPQGVIDAIWLHHAPPASLPETARNRHFAAAVHLADLIVRELRLGYSGNYCRPAASAEVAAELGVPRDKLDAICRGLPEELAKRASVIGMDQLDSRDLYYQALGGANEELAKANAKLLDRTASLSVKARYFDLLGELNRRLRPRSRPLEVADLIGRIILPLTGASRVVVFSESPAAATAPDPPIEGIALDSAQPDRAERFMLEPAPHDVAGLAAARRAGWFDPAQSAEGFNLFLLQGQFSWLHHHLQQPMPLANCFLMPLLAESVWVGGVVFDSANPGEPIAGWPACRGELFALASAAGLAIRTAQVTAAAEQTAEELVQAAEQCARLQEELVRQRTLASVGHMAAGAGHELNDPLMVISGRSELLAAEEPDPKRRQVLDQIRENAQRASSIISELMDFARPPAASPQPIRLEEFLGRLARPLASAGIEVSVRADAGLPPALADPGQLQEVVQEILDNAQQAMAAQDANRKLIVRATQPPLTRLGRPHSPPSGELEIVITDTGVGMTPEVLEHATDPFFSARPAGRGRGLGLARARRLIEHNGGALRLESEPGAGATVHIYVPAAGNIEQQASQ